jgi:hypothetical protein
MSDNVQLAPPSSILKPYHRPAVIHELTLETRAGSPLSGGTLIDPWGLDPTQPN